MMYLSVLEDEIINKAFRISAIINKREYIVQVEIKSKNHDLEHHLECYLETGHGKELLFWDNTIRRMKSEDDYLTLAFEYIERNLPDFIAMNGYKGTELPFLLKDKGMK